MEQIKNNFSGGVKMNNNDKRSAPGGLRYKLRLSLYLMSVLPILVAVYIVSNHILPHNTLKLEIFISLLISIFIAILGFVIIKRVFDRILSMASEAKRIAAGDVDRRLHTAEVDEVGDLGNALNQLTSRIRSSMDELKGYGEKTTEINLEIQKRIMVLSSLLQISSLIAQSAKLDDILKLTVEKSRFIANSEAGYLILKEEKKRVFYAKAADGRKAGQLYKVEVSFDQKILDQTLRERECLVLDKNNLLPQGLKKNLQDKLLFKNVMLAPVFLRDELIGFLGIGNSKQEFTFNKDDIELLDIFAKQIAIAEENDLLTHRIEKLEIKDPLTNLYNETFIRSRLQEEIKRAIVYQRPCAFALFALDNFPKFRATFGSLQAEGVIKKAALLFRDSVREIDRVGRIGDDEFAIVLPERNKRQAQAIAEEIRKKIEFTFGEEPDPKRKITASGGVSENPLDGVGAEELIVRARDLVNQAKKQGNNKIII